MASRKGVGRVHAEWKAVLQELDSAQSRRWKSAAKQSNVNIISVTSQGIEAKVKWHSIGGGKRTFSLRIPVVNWWESYHSQVVTWLARRPDWQAAFLANEWDEDFLHFLSDTGLSLFPTEDYLQRVQKEAVCSCAVPENPCIHMMAVFETIMREEETYPYRALEYVGLSFSQLLNDIHTKTAEWVTAKTDDEEKEFASTITQFQPSVTQASVGSSQTSSQASSQAERARPVEVPIPVPFWQEEEELKKRLQSTPVENSVVDSRFTLRISSEQLEKWGNR